MKPFLNTLLPWALLSVAPLTPLPAANLGQDTWKEDKKNSNLSTLRYWTYLSDASHGKIVEEKGKRFLRLDQGAKLQSVNVAPYGDAIELSGIFDITTAAGAGGFGFIDFSSSLYYYAYWDKAQGKVFLQRGDGDNATVLAEAAAPSTSPVFLKISADFKTKGRVKLQLKTGDHPVLQAEEERPEKMGATYQIYFGASQDAGVDLYELTTITSR